jgi:hypothetical protein
MISETPAPGATGVGVLTTPTATFNQAVVASNIVFTIKNSAGVAVGAPSLTIPLPIPRP